MADGLNEARAMRVAEVMAHYQTIQHTIAQYRVNPPPGQAQAIGFVTLNQCHAGAQALLALPFNAAPSPTNVNSGQQMKQQLQAILLDASSRRFRAYKIYKRTVACMRWVQRRTQLLQGQAPNASHSTALAQNDLTLQTELAAVANQQVYNELRQRDVAAQNWVAEMPSLQAILIYIQTH